MDSSGLRQRLLCGAGDGTLVIDMPPFGNNPFAALSIVVAPAILTSASSVLCLGTSNRLARVVDRTRAVSAQLADLAPNADTIVTLRRQLEELRVRWNLVLRALICFYMSLGSFAAAALVSLVGSSFTAPAMLPPINFIAILGLLSGTVGVGGLVLGCTMMAQETRLAIQNLAEETEIAALTVQTPVMATNRGGEPASIFSIDRPEEAGANQHEPNGGERPPDSQQ
jgi:hypothetical protein